LTFSDEAFYAEIIGCIGFFWGFALPDFLFLILKKMFLKAKPSLDAKKRKRELLAEKKTQDSDAEQPKLEQ
jgi:hypothetical protein